MRDAKKRPDTCIKGMARCRASGVQVQRRHAVLLICKYQSVARLSRPANPAGWALTTFLILLRNQNDE